MLTSYQSGKIVIVLVSWMTVLSIIDCMQVLVDRLGT